MVSDLPNDFGWMDCRAKIKRYGKETSIAHSNKEQEVVLTVHNLKGSDT